MLKDSWIDKTNDESVLDAEDINEIAHAVINNEKKLESIEETKSSVYDKVIKTQEEFEELIASPNWLGAKSVAFVGQFAFTITDDSGITVPSNVKQIHGFNDAKITVQLTGEAFGTLYCFGYDEIDNSRSISNLTVHVDGEVWNVDCVIFKNCSNMYNCCAIQGFVSTNEYLSIEGFTTCNNLISCRATFYGGGDYIGGMCNCQHIVNCYIDVADGYGYNGCSDIVNSSGDATGYYLAGVFYSCDHLANCSGSAYVSEYDPYYSVETIFENCSYCSNCNLSGSMPRNGVFYGTNLYIDSESCEWEASV